MTPAQLMMPSQVTQSTPLLDEIELPPALELLAYEILGSSLLNWAIAVLAGFLTLAVVRIAVGVVAGRLEALGRRTSSEGMGLAAALLRNVKGPILLVVALWAGSLFLALSPAWDRRLGALVGVALLVQLALWATGLVNWGLDRYRDRQLAEDPGVATALGAVGFIARVLVWSVFVLMALGSVGIEIGPLIAGMGVGGIAVALAVQNILGDLFASLSIVFDRPFVIGDFIIVGDQMGTVEHVGLKTTRVRSLSGEQLVFSNSDLLSSRVRNFKRMDERRIVFEFGVQYDTGYARLKEIPGIVRQVIEGLENSRFDRAHFRSFGDSSLDFEVVYFMLVPDFGAYMDVQQAINLELYRIFEERGIEFAFPTRTLHMYLDGADAEVSARLAGAQGSGAEFSG